MLSKLELSLRLTQKIKKSGVVEYTDWTSAESKSLPPMSVLVYDTKQSDGEVLVKLKLWGMQSIPSFPLLPSPEW